MSYESFLTVAVPVTAGSLCLGNFNATGSWTLSDQAAADPDLLCSQCSREQANALELGKAELGTIMTIRYRVTREGLSINLDQPPCEHCINVICIPIGDKEGFTSTFLDVDSAHSYLVPQSRFLCVSGQKTARVPWHLVHSMYIAPQYLCTDFRQPKGSQNRPEEAP